MSICKMFFSGFLILVAGGCSGDIFLVHNGNMPSPDKVALVSPGQTKADVENILGSPSAVTSFDRKTWIYMSSTFKKVAFFEPKETEREILTITFNDEGRVAAIKDYTLDDGQKVAIDTTQTPTVGTELGFFRKYFGGVGAYLPISPGNAGDNL